MKWNFRIRKQFSFISPIRGIKNGRLWNALSKEEKDELVVAELESLDKAQLTSNDDMKLKRKKWL